jgi:hypothetical protein
MLALAARGHPSNSRRKAAKGLMPCLRAVEMQERTVRNACAPASVRQQR